MIRAGLILLATARLIRLLLDDHLGRWFVQQPVTRWGLRHEAERDRMTAYADPDYPHPATWQGKVMEGVACHACIGFWAGLLVILGEILTSTRALGFLRPLWTFTLTALALNQVVLALRERNIL